MGATTHKLARTFSMAIFMAAWLGCGSGCSTLRPATGSLAFAIQRSPPCVSSMNSQISQTFAEEGKGALSLTPALPCSSIPGTAPPFLRSPSSQVPTKEGRYLLPVELLRIDPEPSQTCSLCPLRDIFAGSVVTDGVRRAFTTPWHCFPD